MFTTAFWVALGFLVNFHILEIVAYQLLRELPKETVWWKAVLKGGVLLFVIVFWGVWVWMLKTALELR